MYISFEQDLADGSEIQVFGIKGKQTPGRLFKSQLTTKFSEENHKYGADF